MAGECEHRRPDHGRARSAGPIETPPAGRVLGRVGAVGGRLTWWDASSARPRSTPSGTAMAPRSSPRRASCTWTASSTSGPAGSSGSRCRSITTASWPTGRWPWRSRSAAAKTAIAGVIFHTDQGGEYTAHRFRKACGRIGVRQSMGRPGSALDNAVIESWHSTLEFELRRLEHYATRAEARAGVAAFIDDYNRHRRHSALQMTSPINYELGA